MDKEQIEHRIKTMLLERNALEINHEALIEQNNKTNREFQRKVMENQTRFAQLTGGILELQKLTKGENNEPTNFNNTGVGGIQSRPQNFAGRIPGPDSGDSHNRGIDLGDRAFHQPDPEPG